MWSWVSGIPLLVSLTKQYRQSPPSAASIRARSSSGTYVATPIPAPSGSHGAVPTPPQQRRRVSLAEHEPIPLLAQPLELVALAGGQPPLGVLLKQLVVADELA